MGSRQLGLEFGDGRVLPCELLADHQRLLQRAEGVLRLILLGLIRGDALCDLRKVTAELARVFVRGKVAGQTAEDLLRQPLEKERLGREREVRCQGRG